MKKLSVVLLMLCASLIYAAPAEDNVSEIQETGKQFKQGQYKAGTDEAGPDTKKGSGFDVSAPEILIKGRVDTRVSAVREMSSLYDISSLRGVLYERNKVELPGGLNDEDKMSPLNEGKITERDYALWFKVTGGTANTLFAEGVYGKAFDASNALVLDAKHENYDNPRINSRDTSRNMNDLSVYFAASHEKVTAFYTVKAVMDSYGNPYPLNVFGIMENNLGASASGRFNFDYEGVRCAAGLGYDYFDSYSSSGQGLFRQNALKANASAKKDFALDNGNKAGAGVKLVYSGGPVYTMGNEIQGLYSLNMVFSGSYYTDLFMLRAEVEAVSFHDGRSMFFMAPKLYASYEPLSFLTVYGQFDPESGASDMADMAKKYPFTFVPAGLKGNFDDINAKAGAGINAFEMFFDMYAGIRRASKRTVITAIGEGISMAADSPAEYTFYGVSLATLRGRELSFKTGYEYRLTDETNYAKPLMLAAQEIYADLSFEVSGFGIEVNASGETSKMAAAVLKIPAYLDLGATVTYKINNNVSVFARANNLLNNPEYVVYYYKNKGLNIGLGALINF